MYATFFPKAKPDSESEDDIIDWERISKEVRAIEKQQNTEQEVV